jgi:hypothetical protein
LVITLLAVAACSPSLSPSVTPDPTSGGSTEPSPAPSSAASSGQSASDTITATPTTPRSSGTTPILVIVGGQIFTAELYDNPTAHDLADQLPLTITMEDHNRLEKTGPLPRALTTDGVPAGSDPDKNEIGCYAPGRDLVLYYGDVGYYNGIIRIGRFDDAIDSIADQLDGVAVTVERH